MSRIVGLVSPDIPHHIIQRGNYQRNIFIVMKIEKSTYPKQMNMLKNKR